MQRLSARKKTADRWREMEKKVADLIELVPLVEDDASLAAEIESEMEGLSSRLDELERPVLMNWNWKLLSPVSMMPGALYWRFMPGRGAPSPRTGRRCYSGCTSAGRSGVDIGLTCWMFHRVRKPG